MVLAVTLIHSVGSISIDMCKSVFVSQFSRLYNTSRSITRFLYSAFTDMDILIESLYHCCTVRRQQPKFSVLKSHSCVVGNAVIHKKACLVIVPF